MELLQSLDIGGHGLELLSSHPSLPVSPKELRLLSHAVDAAVRFVVVAVAAAWPPQQHQDSPIFAALPPHTPAPVVSMTSAGISCA